MHFSSSRCETVEERALLPSPKQTKRRKWEVTTLIAELKKCSSTKDLQMGRQVHWKAVKQGNDSHIYVANSLVNMYAKCESMADAHQVFDSMKEPTVVSWNALIMGYVENGEGMTAWELLTRMKSEGYAPNSYTFVAAIKACTFMALQLDGSKRAGCLEQGKQLHLEIGCHSDVYVQSTLIDMYSKCGSMADARQVFDDIKQPNVVSWNALISGYADNGEGLIALNLFAKMKSQRCEPTCITFVAALKACISLLEHDGFDRTECLERGKQIHSESRLYSNVKVQNTLIDMYAKCGSMLEAREVFDSIKELTVVSWNALITGYADNGEGVTALNLFEVMKSQGYTPTCITLVAAFKACGVLGALERGRKIHAEMDKSQCDEKLVTCLVDFYAKCGSLIEAHSVFDSYPVNLISSNALLLGYSRLGDSEAVFSLFERMQDAGLRADGITCLCILTCCCHAGLLENATEFFQAMSTKQGVPRTVEHYTCMVDIFGRSNKLDDAMALVRSMPCRPSDVTWMTVLGACCKWKNLGISRLAFKSAVSSDETNAAAYVLLGNIYESKGMSDERLMVLGFRKRFEFRPSQEQSCWTSDLGQVHSF